MKAVLSVLAVLTVSFATVQSDATCNVIPIERWAGESSGITNELQRPVDLVVVTHTATPGCFTDESCERLARNIRKNHIKQGFDDIRLSFLVGGNGKLYEGAGWRVGGHTSDYNHKSVSLTFIGDFSNEEPTMEAVMAAKRFFQCFINNRYLGCEYKLVGHRQLIQTASPGNALQSLLQTWPHWTKDVSDL